jgi:hypothetical protein
VGLLVGGAGVLVANRGDLGAVVEALSADAGRFGPRRGRPGVGAGRAFGGLWLVEGGCAGPLPLHGRVGPVLVGGCASTDAVGGGLGPVAFGDGVDPAAVDGFQLLAGSRQFLAEPDVLPLQLVDPALGVATSAPCAGSAGPWRTRRRETGTG